MNRTEHLFTILGEECDEVGQRASKVNRFGLSEVQPGQPLTNAERVVEEAKDVITLLTMLRKEGLIPDFMPTREEHLAKVARVEKYLDYSRSIGTLTEWTDVQYAEGDRVKGIVTDG